MFGAVLFSILENESADAGDSIATSFSFDNFLAAASAKSGRAGGLALSVTIEPPFEAAEELARRFPLDGEEKDDRRLRETLRSRSVVGIPGLSAKVLLLRSPWLVPGLDRLPVSLVVVL